MAIQIKTVKWKRQGVCAVLRNQQANFWYVKADTRWIQTRRCMTGYQFSELGSSISSRNFVKLALIFSKDLFIRLQNFPIIWFAEEKDKERIQVFFLFYLYLLFLIASLVISYNTSANSFKCIKVPKTTVARCHNICLSMVLNE